MLKCELLEPARGNGPSGRVPYDLELPDSQPFATALSIEASGIGCNKKRSGNDSHETLGVAICKVYCYRNYA